MREFKLGKSGKLLLSIAAVMVLMATLLVFSASAAVTIDSAADTSLGGTATIEVSGAAGTEQVTLLVYLGTPDDANILYIDQKAADEGAATFTFPVPDDKTEGDYTVLVGSESSTSADSATLTVGEGGSGSDATVSSIAISGTPKTSYNVDDTFDKSAGSVTVTYSDASTATVAFSDSKVSFAGFDSSVAVASQTITVTYTEAGSDPKTATYNVEIVPVPEDEIDGISVSGAQTQYTVGDSFNLTQGTITVSYKSGATDTVDFDETGVVIKVDGVTVTSGFTFDAEGTKTVTVEYEGFNDSYDVTVIAIPDPGGEVTGINMTTTNLKLYGTDSVQLNAAVVPSNALNKTIKYVSLNPNVATVNATGLVTAVALGDTKVVAVTADGGYVAVANVTVCHALNVTQGIRFRVVSDVTADIPVSGVKVDFARGATALGTVYSDAEGYVVLDNIPLSATRIGVTITKDGYLSRSFSGPSGILVNTGALTPTFRLGEVLFIAKLAEDVNGDGSVNIADINDVNKKLSATSYAVYGSN